MLISCIFNYQYCYADDFIWYYDTFYGNCYSFNSGKYINGSSREIEEQVREGPNNGLLLELFVGQPTNISSLSFVHGAHITVYNQSIKPGFNQGWLLLK